MPQSLPTEQKALLQDTLAEPFNENIRKHYSSWLRQNSHKQQADAIDWIIDPASTITTKPKTFADGKREFDAALMQTIGLNPDPNHHPFGFAVKIDGEKLLKNEKFLDLDFVGGEKEVTQFMGLQKRIAEVAGEKAMLSLFAGYKDTGEKDVTKHSEPKPYEHAMYKLVLGKILNSNFSDEQKIAIAQAIYAKTETGHFPEHSLAGQVIHRLTGQYPDDYEKGNGHSNRKLVEDDEDAIGKNVISHRNRVLSNKKNRDGAIEI